MLTSEEKDILKIIIQHELDFYETKEDIYPEDIEYVKDLKNIIKKLESGIK